MGIEELSLAIMRKIRGQNAVRSALPALVLTSSASLGGVNPCNGDVGVMHVFSFLGV